MLFIKLFMDWWAISVSEHIQPNPRVSRNCHSMTFRQVQTSRNFYKYSFFPPGIVLFPLGIVQWNALPESGLCHNMFKEAVDRLHHSRP